MEIEEKLKRLKYEDFIWIIYFFIIVFALLSNHFSRTYLYTNNPKYKTREKIINISIFTITFFIYLYFLLLTTKDISNMEKNFNNKEYRSTFISLIAAILFLIGGSIYLFNEINSNELEEIGFI